MCQISTAVQIILVLQIWHLYLNSNNLSANINLDVILNVKS